VPTGFGGIEPQGQSVGSSTTYSNVGSHVSQAMSNVMTDDDIEHARKNHEKLANRFLKNPDLLDPFGEMIEDDDSKDIKEAALRSLIKMIIVNEAKKTSKKKKKKKENKPEFGDMGEYSISSYVSGPTLPLGMSPDGKRNRKEFINRQAQFYADASPVFEI
jgi:hypothetical protein